MSYLIAVVFDDPDEAARVRETLRSSEKTGYFHMEDSAVVVRDAEGEIHIKDEMDKGEKSGIVWGSLIGLLIGGLMFPVVGIALGALGGAAIGHMVGSHIDSKFVKEVGDSMEPGSSAIFYIFRGTDVDAAVASMRPYKGKVLQTTLPEDAEESLKNELKKSIK